MALVLLSTQVLIWPTAQFKNVNEDEDVDENEEDDNNDVDDDHDEDHQDDNKIL